MPTNIKLGDFNQNSYVTATLADSYFANRRDSDKWDNLATSEKGEVLRQAANDIERFNYRDSKYYNSQGLQFPRSDHEVVTGNCATPISTLTFKNTNLKSSTYGKYPTDYWKYGSVHITSGTPIHDTRVIDESNVTTGSITIASAFSATPTTNSKFTVFAPIYKDIMDAQCEQAIYILKNGDFSSLAGYRDAGVEVVEIGNALVEFKDQFVGNNIPISSVAKKLISRYTRKITKIARA